MRQWEIYDFPFPTPEQPHPCVIISPDPIAGNPDYAQVNCLPCQSLRAREAVKPREVRLNGADGLDGPTIVKCHVILLLPREAAGRLRGTVCRARQREIKSRLVGIFGLHAG